MDNDFKKRARAFLGSLVSHYVFDDGKLVVSHAGIKEAYIGRASGRIREFCLYGDTTGETDDLGLPVRLDLFRVENCYEVTVVKRKSPFNKLFLLTDTISPRIS